MEQRVCVTGASGNLGSYLVKNPLLRGYTVHATIRNLGDSNKVGFLKSLPHAETRLRLFGADIYNPNQFSDAIEGCQIVVHMATPLQHQPQNSQFRDTSEAAVAGVKSIVDSCIRSGTVKRLIYTASVVAASPLKDDGTGFRTSMDESCWTPFGPSVHYSNDFLTDYTKSKTLSEKEVLRSNDGELEVVSLACGLVGGETLVPTSHSNIKSSKVIISQATKDKEAYQMLRFLEELLGKVPLVHIQDVTDAHIFCIEKPRMSGRFLCASAYLRSTEMRNQLQEHFPHIEITQEFAEESSSLREIAWGSRKLEELGFAYRYDVKTILEDSLQSCLKLAE